MEMCVCYFCCILSKENGMYYLLFITTIFKESREGKSV